MIYQGLARVVSEAGRRRRLRSFISFLAKELVAAEMGTFEVKDEDEDEDEDEDDLLVAEDGEVDQAMAMIVEEAFIYSCLASLLLTIVWYRIIPNRSFNLMCWFN